MWHDPRLAGPERAVCAGSRGVWPADRQVPARAADDREDVPALRSRPAALFKGWVAEESGRAVESRRVAREVVLLRWSVGVGVGRRRGTRGVRLFRRVSGL